MHTGCTSRTSCMLHSFMRTPARPQHTSASVMSLTHTAVCALLDPVVVHMSHIGMATWDLLCVEESLAASDKCHFRARHFGRAFILPYKNTWVSRCIIDELYGEHCWRRCLDGSHRSSLTDDYQFELRHQAQLRRRQQRRRSRRARQRPAKVCVAH